MDAALRATRSDAVVGSKTERGILRHLYQCVRERHGMVEAYRAHQGDGAVEPEEESYSAAISASAKGEERMPLLTPWKAMWQWEQKSRVISYNATKGECGTDAAWVQNIELFQETRQRDQSPNGRSRSAAVSADEQEAGWMRPFVLLEEMR